MTIDLQRLVELEQKNKELRQQITHWLENGCIEPPTTKELANYLCGKCGARSVKLWRGVHGCKNGEGHELLCASCLSPGEIVGDDGRVASEYGSARTDQVKGWLPAVPTDGTFWGYTSVPPQPVGWWRGLPTYSTTAYAKLLAIEKLCNAAEPSANQQLSNFIGKVREASR